MRVVFTVLDALPVRHVGADHTPVLHEPRTNPAASPPTVREP